MSQTDSPWEPPLAGSETDHLFGALDRLRTTFRWKADGLDGPGLSATIGDSPLSLGSLLKHLAFVEAVTARHKLAGESPGSPWATVDWDGEPGWDFTSAAADPAAQLYAVYDDAVAEARAIYRTAVADGGLDQVVHIHDEAGRHASLRRLVFDLLEEIGRHTGHADLLREAIDGRVGEDPPAGWRAESGNYPMPGA